jgi:hypothetical protein
VDVLSTCVEVQPGSNNSSAHHGWQKCAGSLSKLDYVVQQRPKGLAIAMR